MKGFDAGDAVDADLLVGHGGGPFFHEGVDRLNREFGVEIVAAADGAGTVVLGFDDLDVHFG